MRMYLYWTDYKNISGPIIIVLLKGCFMNSLSNADKTEIVVERVLNVYITLRSFCNVKAATEIVSFPYRINNLQLIVPLTVKILDSGYRCTGFKSMI